MAPGIERGGSPPHDRIGRWKGLAFAAVLFGFGLTALGECAVAASPAAAPSPARRLSSAAAELLRRSVTASATCDYRGTKTLVFHGGDRPRQIRLRVIHLRPDRTRTEFIFPQRMRNAVRLEVGRNAWRFDPGRGEWRRIEARGPAETNAEMDLARLLANYTVTTEGTGRVAGRRCDVIRIKPRRSGNPSRRVWVDTFTGLLLRTQFFGADGDLISEAAFADIRFEVPKAMGELLRPPQEALVPAGEAPTLGFEPVKPSYVPVGYEEVASTPMSVRGRVICHLRYSDGLGSISLFEERTERGRPPRPRPEAEERGGPPPPDRRAHGERHDRGERREFPRMLRWQHSDMRFALIGDVSREGLLKIAASLPGGEAAGQAFIPGRPRRPAAPRP